MIDPSSNPRLEEEIFTEQPGQYRRGGKLSQCIELAVKMLSERVDALIEVPHDDHVLGTIQISRVDRRPAPSFALVGDPEAILQAMG